MYDLNDINDLLNTNIIGRTIIQYDKLASTFSKAKSIFNSCPSGAVVLSEYQSKWKVRMNNEWICYPEKNINLSIILKDLVNNHSISKFDIICCTSLCKALNDLYEVNCKVKWPNDILINDRKVLSVSSTQIGKDVTSGGVIISIGINTNMSKEEIESNEVLKDISTSLLIETNYEIHRETLISEILNNLEYYYSELIRDNSIENAVSAYNEKFIFINKTIEVTKKGKKTKRKVRVSKVNSEGSLVVINEKGNEEILNPGETFVQYEKDA